MNEFNSLSNNVYSFRCNGIKTKEIKGICKAFLKNIEFEEYKKCLDGENYQHECDNNNIRSLYHEMYQCIHKKKNLLALHLMINNVLKKLLKVQLGSEELSNDVLY